MKKVIHVISDHNLGGAGRWLLTACEQIDRNKITIVAVVPTGSVLVAELKKRNIKVIELDYLTTSFHKKSILPLIRTMKTVKPHIVHTHASLSARIAGKLLRIPIIYTRHTLANTTVAGFKKIMNNFLCTKAVAVSKSVYENLKQTGMSEQKIRLIYNGVRAVEKADCETVLSTKKQYGIPEDAFVFGVVGRLSEEKGQRYLMQAFEQFIKTYPKGFLVLVGDGPNKELLRKMMEVSNLQQRVVLTGVLMAPEAVMQTFDVSVTPSLSEAFSLSACEAMGMGAGIACIATDSGGVSEVVLSEETGLIVPPGDAQALYEAMKRLYEDEAEREKFAFAGKRRMMQNFTLEQMVEKLTLLYEETGGRNDR